MPLHETSLEDSNEPIPYTLTELGRRVAFYEDYESLPSGGE